MNPPVFSMDFVLQACLRVREERRSRKVYLKETLSDDEAPLYAECAFASAGFGFTCENCKMHVSSCKNLLDCYPQDKFYDAIRRYTMK